MIRDVSQKDALEIAIEATRNLMESTKNRGAQIQLEAALTYLGNVRSFIQDKGIPEYDSVLFMNITYNRVRLTT